MLLENYFKKTFDFELLKNPKSYFFRLNNSPYIKTPLIWIFIISIISALLTSFYIDLKLADASESILFLIVGVLIGGGAFPIFKLILLTTFHYFFVKILRTTATFKLLFSMNTHIYLLLTFGYLINSLVSILFGFEISLFSLNFIIQADGVLAILFDSIDLFALLAIVLTAIGLQVVGKFSTIISWFLAISLYILEILYLFTMYKFNIL